MRCNWRHAADWRHTAAPTCERASDEERTINVDQRMPNKNKKAAADSGKRTASRSTKGASEGGGLRARLLRTGNKDTSKATTAAAKKTKPSKLASGGGVLSVGGVRVRAWSESSEE